MKHEDEQFVCNDMLDEKEVGCCDVKNGRLFVPDGKGLAVFLLLCLPVSWILMGVSLGMEEEGRTNALKSFLLVLSMFVPMLAALVTCRLTKEGFGILQIFPRFRNNGKTYVAAVLFGILLSVADYFLVVLIFPEVMHFDENAMPGMLFMIMLLTMMGVLQSFGTLGEEIGWMGYFYPELEKRCGTTLALIFTGVVRALWHVVMLFYGVDFKVGLESFGSLCISNILLGSVLVLLTKKSHSVVPATFTHALTNAVPTAVMAYVVTDDTLYEKYATAISVVTMIPMLVAGLICYAVLVRKYPAKKDMDL